MTEHTSPETHRDRSGTGETGPLFSLGQVVATPGALETCLIAEVTPLELIHRHASGDWGDMCQEDLDANDQALQLGGRLFSAYDLATAERLWVITEADRSVTTLLRPQEY